MADKTKSTFPGAIRDSAEAVKAEAEQVSAKIEAAFQKLATKMSERAEKAKAKMDQTRKLEKRAILLRRFELYADAATHLRERHPQRED